MMRHWLLIYTLMLLALEWRTDPKEVRAENAPAPPLVSRPSVDLSGEWEFKLDPLDVGRAEKWFASNVVYDRKIRVPGAWNAQGVAFESEKQLREYEKNCLEEQTSLNKLGILGGQRESDRLFHVYPGPGWYRKQITIPQDWRGKTPWLHFSGVHREAEVWVNGNPAGAHHSYLTPLRIDLSPYVRGGEAITIVVRVDARRNRDTDPLMGCLDTLDFLYVNWGGIHQPVMLEAVAPTRIEDIFVLPHLAEKTAEVRVTIGGAQISQLRLAAEIIDSDDTSAGSVAQSLADNALATNLVVPISSPKLWSPNSPHLYTARIRLYSKHTQIDERAVRFGMRDFKVAAGKFLLNGKPIFLRGYGDDCIFPNTICPPTNKEELRSRLGRAREYGFNFVRHHSWVPPEAYLQAADELGMMLQPEFPFAYGWDLPKTLEARRAALEQWEAVVRLNRNHPSIVSWCMGNEQYNSFDLAMPMYQAAKRLDPTRPVIDSDGCGFNHADRESLDYLVVQFGEGNSIGFQDNKYLLPPAITKPVIAHEMGYFVTLHDLASLERFATGLRPYWLFQTRELAEKNQQLREYPDWLSASYRLQAACLKCNLEAARRSRLSGTSVWLFQDYPNCAEGVVDMFGRDKGLTAAEFRKFNAPTVILLDAPRRNWWSGESAEIKFVVSRFEDETSEAATLHWRLDHEGQTIAQGAQSQLSIRSGEVVVLPSFKFELPNLSHATRLTLRGELSDANGKAENSWNFWVFPRDHRDQVSTNVMVAGFDPLRGVCPESIEYKDGPVPAGIQLMVATRLDDSIIRYLTDGGRVLLLNPEPSFAVEKTNFRLSSWDGGGPSGTILDQRHPALREMPTEGWCDLQFYSLIQDSKTVLLTTSLGKIEPLVRCIDRPTRLANRAYLFEVSVGRGKLMVSGFNFAQSLAARDPAGTFLLDRLLRYGCGAEFEPEVELPPAALQTKAAK